MEIPSTGISWKFTRKHTVQNEINEVWRKVTFNNLKLFGYAF